MQAIAEHLKEHVLRCKPDPAAPILEVAHG